MIAAVTAFTFRFEITPAPQTLKVFRLDRWTGEIRMCGVDYESYADADEVGAPTPMRCAPMTSAEIEAAKERLLGTSQTSAHSPEPIDPNSSLGKALKQLQDAGRPKPKPP
jgi:hypothetical protein